jgi:hypothetical protein
VSAVTSVLKAGLDTATSTIVPLTRTGFAISGIPALLEVPLAMAGPPTSTEAAITAATACRARFTVVFMLMEIMFESPDGSNVWFEVERRPAAWQLLTLQRCHRFGPECDKHGVKAV